jgi:two-component system, NtrC family, nitrogen regulation response regulator GlnG
MSNRVLVHVDDDADEAFLFERALARGGIQGWDYHYVADAYQAMEYLRRTNADEALTPHLMIIDVKMPGIGGLELLEWIADNHPGIPVVMLSSSDLLQDRLRARNLGSRGYFVKSSTHEELMMFLGTWQKVTTEEAEALPLPG